MKTNQYLLREATSIVLKFPHALTELMIEAPTLFVLGEGYGAMKIKESSFELTFGCLLFAHAGASVVISSHNQSNLHLYMIQFDQYKQMKDTREELIYHLNCEGLPDNGIVATNRAGALLELFKALIEVSQSEAGSNPFEEQRLLLGLLQEVLIAGQNIPYYDHASPIQKVVHYIRENFNTKLQRSFLAHLTGYHPHYLSKQFNKEMGQSISDFILQIRIDKAKELLSISSCSINEVASSVGYQDALYFSRKFKQATGMYPTEFRQRPKRIVAFQFIGTLLALGITPVGIDAHLVRHSQQISDLLTGIVCLDEWDSQKVRLLNPDIIVAPNYLRSEQLRHLRTVAPVIVQSWEDISPLERVRIMGKLLDKQLEAEDWIIQFNQMAKQLKQKLSLILGTGETAAAYEIADGNVYVLSRQDRGAYALYDVLGFNPPAAVSDDVLKVGKSKLIAIDELTLYAADRMVVSIYDEDGMERTSQLLASEAWQQLPAVRKGMAYQIPVNKCFSNDGVSLQRLTSMLAQLILSR